MAAALRHLTQVDSRVSVQCDSGGLGLVAAYNGGLTHREGDAVLLSASAVVTEGWLRELALVAHAEERTACVAPVSGSGRTCEVSRGSDDFADYSTDAAAARAACSGLPRWTMAPVLEGPCIYLRGALIDAVGLLDPAYTSMKEAILDWLMRAQALGFTAKLANHAYVHQLSSPSTGLDEELPLDGPLAGLDRRHPQLRRQVESFGKTLDSRLAVHALGLQATGRLRVAFDLRHLPENEGTRIYALNLAKALEDLPEIDLSLLVDSPEDALGLKGRVVRSGEWNDDVAVIHRPAQVFDRQELALLYGSRAHVVITSEDLIGGRFPIVFPCAAEFAASRTTSSLSLLAAQGILAHSESSRREIAAAFGIPCEEISIAPLAEQFLWEKTARAVLEVYRSAVLRPSERSLQMRRLLGEVIARLGRGWSARLIKRDRPRYRTEHAS